MTHYTVQEVKNPAGELLGWAVFDAAGTQVSNAYSSQSAAESDAAHRNARDLSEEEALQELLDQANDLSLEATLRDNGDISGTLRAMNQHYLLINAGRGKANIAPRATVEEANITPVIGVIIRFKLRDGKAIKIIQPQRSNSLGY